MQGVVSPIIRAIRMIGEATPFLVSMHKGAEKL
jgi:hypothetical protein